MDKTVKDNEMKEMMKVMKAMKDCPTSPLAAAIALLPDIREDGTAVVMAAVTRVAAERFTKEEFLEQLSKAIDRQTQELARKKD